MYKYIIFCFSFICLGFAKAGFAQPSANFTADTARGCAPLAVKFRDLTTGNPTSWSWDLGNGTTSTQQNPTTLYFDPGTYTIRLIARNGNGADTIIRTQFITVYGGPTVNFTAAPLNGCAPLQVNFTDQSTPTSGSITTWEWDFGDGNFSNLQQPIHTYNLAGTYTVALRVRNSNGCAKIGSKQNYITVQPPVTADFTFTTTSACAPPTTVSFTNTATGNNITSYSWDFGDGSFSVGANPVHTYTTPGLYTVQLAIANNVGCRDTIIKPNVIDVDSVRASFSMPSTVCQGAPLLLTNTSRPVPGSALWNFGDGRTSTNTNPQIVYSTPGTYTIKLVNTSGPCVDSMIKTITVLPKPSADFVSTTTTSGCALPFTVSFTSNAPNIVNYTWNFGDGGTATTRNPNHTYTTLGNYNVALSVLGSNGCRDTVVKPNFVTLVKPVINGINGIPFGGCVPYNANFSANITTPEPIATYLWNFGDGNTSAQATPAHNYSTPGVYSVTLSITTINGCIDSFRAQSAIIIDVKPIIGFYAVPTNVCALKEIQFTDTSINATSWNWFFGDGQQSALQNPQHHYVDTGFFTVKLIVSNNFCTDTLTKVNYVYVRPPVANFIHTYQCNTPLLKTFEDKSIAAATWQWDFGDGTSSTAQNPAHIYSSTGQYNVRLIVSNGTCTDTVQRTITVYNDTTDFTISDTVRCRNTGTLFTANTAHPNYLTNYAWNFGDGTGINGGAIVNHIYITAGNFLPSLITTDLIGCQDTIIKPIDISIYGPTANFSNNPGTCINTAITFTDLTQNLPIYPVVKWIWNYGDGRMDSLNTGGATHVYNATGTYNVSLVTRDAYGCFDSIVKPQAVIITDPVAGFTISDSIKCTANNIQFTNQSAGLDLTYSWNFGDGNTSSLFSPAHLYNVQNIYDVSLQVSDRFGCRDTMVKTSAIRIANVKANFTIPDSISSCSPVLIDFINTSANYTALRWSFGDGSFSTVDSPSHFYITPNIYQVVLYTNGYGTCTDTLTKDVIVKGPVGNFVYSPLKTCAPGIVSFTASTTNNAVFIWDFGDGNTNSSSDSVISHQYITPGLYKPKLVLADIEGCQLPITGRDTIIIADVAALIAAAPHVFCDSATIQFQDSAIAYYDQVATHWWNFGDGNTSTQRNPNHTYSTPGLYQVQHAVSTVFGCRDTTVLGTPIRVVKSPQATIIADDSICVNTSNTFSGSLLVADTSQVGWRWNFANGNTSNVQNPAAQLYGTPGNFTIRAIATNSSGCVDTALFSLAVIPYPIVNAGNDTTICKGDTIQLQPTGAMFYSWNASPTLSCLHCQNPLAYPSGPQANFIVTGLLNGCASQDTIQVQVLQPFKITTSLRDTLCVGESLQLTASGTDRYVWSPASTLSNATIANPVAKPASTTDYRVIGMDKKGCFSDTGYVPVVVYPIPVFNIVNDVITVAAGTNVTILTTGSADIIAYKWTPVTYLACNTCPQPATIARSTITYKARVSNAGGCMAEDQVTIQVFCNNGNVYMPNTFSPNNDGMNDAFYPRGKGVAGIRSLQIFNRWGGLVFQRNNFSINDAGAGWDGTYKGQPLTPDVYIYQMEVICDNSEIFPMKGNVTLLR